MVSRNESLNFRISASYKQLTAAAAELNAVSDELGKFINALDSALRRLNWALPHGFGSTAARTAWVIIPSATWGMRKSAASGALRSV